jgi:catechol-2,3-dioxygenase
MYERGKQVGIDTRGYADHQFIDSIYFRDPNGYVIELTAKRENHDTAMDEATNEARTRLDEWQRSKPRPAT